MPVSTPDDLLKDYGNDAQHFIHVLEHLFIPSVKACGLEPIPPLVAGSDVIHGEIVKNLSASSLVLCDMSQLNPNVFFEFGIRTALNKSVALVVDDKTRRIPFDTGIINYHKYESDLRPWAIEDERAKLTKHIEKTLESDPDKNALWKYFGVTQTGSLLNPEQITSEDKVDLILNKLDFLTKGAKSNLFRFNLDISNDFPSWREALTAFQKDYFNQLLQSAGSREEAYRRSGLSRSQFYEKLKDLLPGGDA
jgi:hypothetical protein